MRPFVRFLQAQGCPTERHLEKAHLSPVQFYDDHAPIPALLAYDFVDRAARGEGIEHIGTRVGRLLQPSDLGSFRLIMGASRNLYEYLEGVRRHAKSVSSHTAYRMSVEGDAVRLEYLEEGTASWMHGHLLTMTAAILTIQSVAGSSWRPADVVLPGGTVSGLPEASDILERAQVDRGARGSSLLFPISFLSLPAPGPGTRESLPPEDALSSHQIGAGRHAMRGLIKSLVLGGHADVRAAAGGEDRDRRALASRGGVARVGHRSLPRLHGSRELHQGLPASERRPSAPVPEGAKGLEATRRRAPLAGAGRSVALPLVAGSQEIHAVFGRVTHSGF